LRARKDALNQIGEVTWWEQIERNIITYLSLIIYCHNWFIFSTSWLILP
jgi:hypothetical protein